MLWQNENGTQALLLRHVSDKRGSGRSIAYVMCGGMRSTVLHPETLMPRYYFDIYDGQSAQIDNEGHVFATIDSVRAEAQRLLPEVAVSEIPGDGDHRFYLVLVRNEDGQSIYSATLTYHGNWLKR